jgi:hypothetical protein
MAARKDSLHSERVRQRIKLSQLVTRLEKNSLGEIEMTQPQIDSAKFLVNKAMGNPPELKKLEHSGELTTRLLIND